jgi:pimeloyl-ACP methyl ester carboxylesterase
MSTFVLVHGAWQTAATWDPVVPLLRTAGHRVFAPVLTGIDPGASRLTREVGLDTHVSDLVQLLETFDLREVVLVGHSYAGMIITGVAEHAAPRIAKLVYVDAFIPEHGVAAIRFFPPPLQERLRAEAAQEGDGFRLRASDRQLDLWGLKPGPAREFARARLHDFSLRCFEQPLDAPAGRARGLARAYLACVGSEYPARPIFARFYQRARSEGWPNQELPTGHDCHIETPEPFVRSLVSLSEFRSRGADHVTPPANSHASEPPTRGSAGPR